MCANGIYKMRFNDAELVVLNFPLGAWYLFVNHSEVSPDPFYSSIRTMGMSTSSTPKKQPVYDPARQWGLKPEPDAGSSTYVVSGHIVNGSGTDSRSIYATENLGREGQARAKRKLSGKDGDIALKRLLKRDKEGMKAVITAREAGKAKVVDHERSGKKDKTMKGMAGREGKKGGRDDIVGDEPSDHLALPSKNAYSAEVIKNLGFDPVARTGQRKGDDSDMKKKVRFYFFLGAPELSLTKAM